MSPNKATYSLVFCGAPSSGTGSFKRPGGKGRRRRGSLRGRGAPGRPPPGGQRDRGRPPPAAAERRRVQHRGADSSRRPRCGERPALGPAGGGSAPPASGGENGEGGGQGEGSIAPTERERELQLAIDSEIYRQGDSPFCKNSLSLVSVHAPH